MRNTVTPVMMVETWFFALAAHGHIIRRVYLQNSKPDSEVGAVSTVHNMNAPTAERSLPIQVA